MQTIHPVRYAHSVTAASVFALLMAPLWVRPLSAQQNEAKIPGRTAGDQPVSRILFGSCIREDRPMPILETVAARRPDLFIFLGDNIYADTTDMGTMRAKYARLKANQSFARLRDLCPLLATWDDHDFGENDAGRDYPQRTESQRIFVDFWGDAADSPRRQRPGIYDSRVFGPPGKRVQVILLDTRYFRGPLKEGERRVGGPYLATEDDSIPLLGEAQWNWLERQLRVPAELRIIASSIQCVAEASGQETWSNLPHERKRLFELITSTDADGVLIISGDRHWSEVSVIRGVVPYPLYDFTSSSLNQVHPRGTPTRNRYRFLPETYHRENFGELVIQWDRADPAIIVKICDVRGDPQIEVELPFSDLRRPPTGIEE